MSNMVVRTNINSLNAHRNMKNTGLEQRRAASRLSSGFRINSAADDAAGLAISETMRAQIRGLDRASMNAQEGINLTSVADGALNEIHNMLHRMRELSVQAANDTNTFTNREQITLEIAQLTSEINRLLETAEFNGIPLFDGSFASDFEWMHGLKQPMVQRYPAIITAGNSFVPYRIEPVIPDPPIAPPVPNEFNRFVGPAWQQILPGTGLGQINFAELEGNPPTDPLKWPREGIFVIQVQLPGEPLRNEVINFGMENNLPYGKDGDFNLADFREFFLRAFSDLLCEVEYYPFGTAPEGDGQLELEISLTKGIVVETRGFQSGDSWVHIGAINQRSWSSESPPDFINNNPQPRPEDFGFETGTVFANSALLGATQNATHTKLRLKSLC